MLKFKLIIIIEICKSENIFVSTRQPNNLQFLIQKFGFTAVFDNDFIVKQCSIIFICVQAHQFDSISSDVRKIVSLRAISNDCPFIISSINGLTLQKLKTSLTSSTVLLPTYINSEIIIDSPPLLVTASEITKIAGRLAQIYSVPSKGICSIFLLKKTIPQNISQSEVQSSEDNNNIQNLVKDNKMENEYLNELTIYMLCDNISEIVNSFKQYINQNPRQYSQDIWAHKFSANNLNLTEIQIVMKFKELCKLLN